MAHSINIAKEFTTTPGPRHIDEGDFSGELFREELLVPAFEKAVALKQELLVDLTGTEGYATSFLEEAFGGLARKFGDKSVSLTLRFVCTDDPYLIDEIAQYIAEANAPNRRLNS